MISNPKLVSSFGFDAIKAQIHILPQLFPAILFRTESASRGIWYEMQSIKDKNYG